MFEDSNIMHLTITNYFKMNKFKKWFIDNIQNSVKTIDNVSNLDIEAKFSE